MSNGDTTLTPKTTTKPKLERPKLYKVLLVNDDYTPRDFVVLVLKAVFRMSRAVMRGMMKARVGRIINISSVVGYAGNAGQANYCATKAGVAGMGRALARELGSRNITVNCVAPGFIDTHMTQVLDDKHKADLLANVPLGRLGTAEDVAAAVGFLASPDAAYITGTTIHVNGGMYMS